MSKIKLSNKSKKIITPTIYVVLIMIFAYNAVTLFNNNYYTKIYVDGQSMSPTLNLNAESTSIDGGTLYENAEYGIVDEHDITIKKAQRFDIITCYYPWSDYKADGELNNTADFKIKRIIATPGETFKIEGQTISYLEDNNWVSYDLSSEDAPFHISSNTKNISERTLGENEYWVMGDNWGNSYDSSSVLKPIKYENITGVLVMIKGTCTIKKINDQTKISNYVKYSKPRLFF